MRTKKIRLPHSQARENAHAEHGCSRTRGRGWTCPLSSAGADLWQILSVNPCQPPTLLGSSFKNKHSARILQESRKNTYLTKRAWLWIDGIGNPDFSFAECCEICSLDPLAVREAFHALFDSDDDIKEIDWWVRRRCDLTGCLWAGENIHED